jgi:hypothetical protein
MWRGLSLIQKESDNTLRFCGDYRKLNHVTRKDPYPLPRIDESLDSLGGAHFLCRMDLASGYWQLKISDNDKQKTAFATHRGLFQVMSRVSYSALSTPCCNIFSISASAVSRISSEGTLSVSHSLYQYDVQLD